MARLVAAQPRGKDDFAHPVRSFLAQGETHRQPFGSPTRRLNGGPLTSSWTSFSWTVDATAPAVGSWRKDLGNRVLELASLLDQRPDLFHPFIGNSLDALPAVHAEGQGPNRMSFSIDAPTIGFSAAACVYTGLIRCGLVFERRRRCGSSWTQTEAMAFLTSSRSLRA